MSMLAPTIIVVIVHVYLQKRHDRSQAWSQFKTVDIPFVVNVCEIIERCRSEYHNVHAPNSPITSIGVDI